MPRRQPDTRASRRFGLWLSLVALAGALALALTAPADRGDRQANLSILNANGTLAHDNSRDGSAILTASGVWPGWSDSGDVVITNSGTVASWLRLTESDVADVPGPGGGELSDGLSLTVEDVTVPAFPVPIYTGALGAVGERWLGKLEPSDVRTYRFSTSMPTGSGDNSFQASAVSVRFEWAVSDTEPDTDPPVDPPIDPPVDPPVGPPVDPPVDPVDPPADAVDPPIDPVDPVDPPDVGPEDPPIRVVPDGPPVVDVSRTKLRLLLAVPTTQRPLKRRKLVAMAMCSRRCRATFTAKMSAGRPRARRVARKSRSLSAGVKKRVKLRLSRKTVRSAFRRLGRGRSVRAVVRVVARDHTGRTVRAKQRVRLVPVRRR